MTERFKRTLTQDHYMGDLMAKTEAIYREDKNSRAGCMVGLGLFSLLPLAATVAGIVYGSASGLVFLVLLITVAMLVMLIRSKPKKTTSLPAEQITVVRDTVVSRRRESNGDGYSYFLTFQHSGDICVPVNEPLTGFSGHHLTYPIYSDVREGDSFLIVTCPTEIRGQACRLFYSATDWKLRDLTAEELEEELRQEDELISRLLACQRFPRLNILQDYFQESRYLHQVRQGRPREGLHLAESMAAQHFGGELVSALEFVLRYCPESLQEEARGYYTPTQLQLEDAVRRYIKTDNAKTKRQEAAAKLRSAFSREDPDE